MPLRLLLRRDFVRAMSSSKSIASASTAPTRRWNAARTSRVIACCSEYGALAADATSSWMPANGDEDGVDEIRNLASKRQSHCMSDYRHNILGRAFQVVPGVEFSP